ncbi:putative hydrolase of the HAD superfamily [Mesoflavibacter sabulilitoris]|uniref:Haloacid dehalogenase n=1 Tax=Mesoflavibacter zeaxanthinifaciens subsp. sabulilitoris TaxID=1520893 RepID=A0A2T1NH66_9FLAO|nr:HAD family phosphatase [Mesoflavibacter zeaxanthinifaciens]MBB3122690.1 putative hydrolase of the HAD superfamily [Mesoflavibacter zeaxanthinifaciens subsp. sabulilitoris]PSG92221.1 haloacid dehalogenase [Mesoflavibacter zeaxanthinifaciens subsp. sabulilitoris]
MIKTIIFDFGDVFINLDKEGALKLALEKFEITELDEELQSINALYEQGLISTDEFLEFYADNFPRLPKDELKSIWNYIIKDFPEHRLQFIKQLAKDNNHQLILLSNTNELHIDYIKKNVSFYEDFKNCFDQFYLSHEINLRKPNADIFNFVLTENKLNAEECLFIDDTLENTQTAQQLGINVWNNNPAAEDIVDIFTIKNELF